MRFLIKEYIRKLRVFNKFGVIKKIYGNTAPNPVEIDTLPGDNFLIIAPHPDDEAIGCAGLTLLLKKQNKNVCHFYNKIPDERRKTEALEYNKTLGTQSVFVRNYFRDELKQHIGSVKIDAVLLPSFIDNHREHFGVCEDLYYLLKTGRAPEFKIIMYEVWTPVQPNVIVDITGIIDRKIELLKIYKSQLANKNYIHSVIGFNAYRALLLKRKPPVNLLYAESFVLLHSIDEYIELFEHCRETV